MMVRAAEAEIGDGGPPARSVTVHFLEAPRHGPAEIAVEILRAGKRVVFCEVRMRQADRLVAQMTVVFSAARPQERGLTRTAPPAPDARSVNALEFGISPRRLPFTDQLEMRPTFGAAAFSGAAEAVTGGWLNLRDDPTELDAARLVAFSDLWLPAIFPWMSAPAGAPTVQLTIYLRSTETAAHGPVLARFETRTVLEGHFEERGELWSSDGQLLSESVQLALWLPFKA
jgi:acyl-CoA thioesterase